jgi:alpha-tubulin suppressor-like RCC1 family protein
VKSWGTNPNGLGYAFNIQDDGIPQMVYELKNKKVIQIAASGDVSNEKCALSLALTEDGKVYCWGSNEESGPSNNNIIPTSFPSMINFSGKKITSVYSGSLKALVMTESGVLYVWGNTGLARIGKSNVPIELTEFKGQEVLDVFSDHDNVFVLCQE